MRVLITGGAGFVGSHLAEKYLRRGDEVYIIDDLSTGSLNNLTHLVNDSRFSERLHVTVSSIFDHAKMVDLVGICDSVVHLAAAVGVKYIIDNPLTSITTNVRGTDIVLELCSRFRKRVLITSTSEVYGKHDHAPLVETDNCIYGSPDKLRWSYAAAKLIDEFSAIAHYRVNQLPTVVVRLFNVIGPRQTGEYGMVVPSFIDQALKNMPITVFGDGTQTRTFTHVKEVVGILMGLMETPKALGEVINVGGTEEVSILELAERIKIATNSKSEIKIIPYEQAYSTDFEDMPRRVPSTEKLKGIVGITPTLSLDEILVELVEFRRAELQGLLGKNKIKKPA